MPVGTTNASIPGSGIHHIAIHTRDWQASLKLYCDILGMRVVSEFGTPERPVLMLDTGDGAHVELFAPLPDANSDATAPFPMHHLALATTDVHAAIERVRAAGYPITIEPKDVQLGSISATIAFFTGPNGEVLEFFQTNL
jgi:catechol 2,3-dioxygenase-like lactoylglutathione lyase family enzyme